MRAKGAIVLVGLVASLFAGGAFGFAILLDGQAHETSSAPSFGAADLAPTPSRDVGTSGGQDVESASGTGWSLWLGALVSATVFLGSLVAFRVQVREQKERLRARRQRMDYHRQLRAYSAQLKGPRRGDN